MSAARRGGRRAGATRTREAILESARSLFAELGYQGATIRAIAAAAGVDPALVHHFYGTKEALFAAAMQIPVLPSEALTEALSAALRNAAEARVGSAPGMPGAVSVSVAGRPVPGVGLGVAKTGAASTGGAGAGVHEAGPGFGAHMVRAALTLWESDQLNERFLGLLRTAVTSERAATMLSEFIADSILGTIARVAGLHLRGGPGEVEYRVTMVATQMLGLALTRLVLRLPAAAGPSVDELAATIGPSIERYMTGDIALPEGRTS
ncbi:MAG TPA: TetR family transcriptional regulator [Streptosporangiaceae bacterium]|nr:TetR family transcriptional regulator [Streptosporangiaceae bacterium]